MKHETQNRVESLQRSTRDLLGFVRVENAVLMDQGHLTLRGLYLQKMILLKDLEERAEALSQEKSDEDIAECLLLLRQVQRELKINAVHHLEALKKGRQAHYFEDECDEQEGGYV